MRRLFAHRDARLYLSGQVLSSIGDSSLWLALGIWVKILTHSNSEAGLVFGFFACGLLLGPACGLLADRVPRKPLLTVVNLATAAVVISLLLVHSKDQIWLIYAVMFAYGVANTLLSSAQTALLAVMVPRELLGEANMVLQIGSQGTRIFTPLLGAGLLAWIGATPVIVLDAATFLAAAAATASLHIREVPAKPRKPWKTEFTAGIRWALRSPLLRRLLVTFVISLSVFGFIETIAYAIVGQGLHRNPPFLGVLLAILAGGAIAGALTAAPLMSKTSERTAIAVGIGTCAVACLLLAASLLPLIILGSVLLGVSMSLVNVASATLLQRRTPTEILGRVESALGFAATLPQVLSIALGAALINFINYHLLLFIMAAGMVAAGAYLIGEPAGAESTAASPVAEPSAQSRVRNAPAVPD